MRIVFSSRLRLSSQCQYYCNWWWDSYGRFDRAAKAPTRVSLADLMVGPSGSHVPGPSLKDDSPPEMGWRGRVRWGLLPILLQSGKSSV